MIIATLPIRPSKSGARGPGDYFKRKLDSRGNPRDPKELFGNFDLFERCVARSEAAHPYLSYIISYKGEETLPSDRDRKPVHTIVLRWFASGLAEESIMAIGIDHGNHEHGALLRHAVHPSWPPFQPYYHPIDGLGLSDLQWLINRRYNLRAPEDPRTHQLISLAGKHFRNDDADFMKRARLWVAGEQRKPNGLRTHEEFLLLLNSKGYSGKVKLHPKARQETNEWGKKEANRVWMEVTSAYGGPIILIKGPLCDPDYERTDHENKHKADVERYQDFMRNPYRLWGRFQDGVRLRHARMRQKFPGFMDKCCDLEFLGFEDLHPARHLKVPGKFGGDDIA